MAGMRALTPVLLLTLLPLAAASCGKDEGLGGSSTPEPLGGAPATGGTAGAGAGGPAGAAGMATGGAGTTPVGIGVRFEAECAHGAMTGDCGGLIAGLYQGTQVEGASTTVGYFDEGDYLAYPGVDLTGANVLSVLYATQGGGVVEVRIDAVDGPVIGTWEPTPTGGWTNWQPANIALTPTSGVHVLYVVGNSGNGICNLDYLELAVCTPDCTGKTCGDDGCGNVCGTCTGTDFCDTSQVCQPCVPDCEGKACGDDTCGGTCGTPCATGEVCTADRECVAYATLGGPPRLHVEGRDLKDEAGATVVLKGVSLIDIGQQHAWKGGIPAMIDRLTDTGWGTQIVRFPIYDVDPWPFLVDNAMRRENYMDVVLRPAVDYATSKGLYVIIDWHRISNVSAREEENARKFWAYMGGQFADYPNVIYELYNEPIDNVGSCVSGANDDCWPPFKAQAEGWLEALRPVAPDTLVLVGGPSWSQVIGPAADDPVADPNVAYVGHIYPFHMGNTAVEDQITRCAAVHPVVITEWGFGFETGDDVPYKDRIRALIEDNQLSWTAWVADDAWGPPMFNEDGSTNAFGDYVQAWLAE